MTDKSLFQPVLRATQLHLDVRVVVVKVEFGLVRISTVMVRDFSLFTYLLLCHPLFTVDLESTSMDLSVPLPPAATT